MERARVVQRTLEIDAASDPLRGRVTDEELGDHCFTGWLELFAVIEDLRASLDTASGRTYA
jgi:hypothetical protein